MIFYASAQLKLKHGIRGARALARLLREID
jgi:hypothetical protein